MYKMNYVSAIIDNELNIIKCNCSLYELTDNPNLTTLKDFLSELDCQRIMDSFELGEGKFFCNVSSPKNMSILIEIKEHVPGLYKLSMYEVLGMAKILSEVEEQTAIYESIVSSLNVEYFIYDNRNDILTYKNSKGINAKFTFKSFLAHLKHNFINIDKINIFKENLYSCDKHQVFDANINDRKIKITLSPFYNALDEKMVLGTIVYDNLSNAVSNTNIEDDLDGLTRLLNKTASERHITNRVEMSREKTTLMIVDIDDFKIVNDTYGHKFGDEILKKVAKIIKNSIGYNGVAGRFGGDEFVVALNTTDLNVVREIAKNIRMTVQWLSTETNDSSIISCSIGCARYPEDVNNVLDLFKLADKCLYRAKNKGKNRYVLYNYEIHGDMLNKGIGVTQDLNHINIFKDENFEMIDNLYKENVPYEKIFERLFEMGQFDRAIFYTGEKLERVSYFLGNDSSSFDGSYIVDESYIQLFDKQPYLSMNNATSLLFTHREIIEELTIRGVKSFYQYLFKDNNGKVLGAISLEVLNNPRTFSNEETYFYTLICKLLQRLINRK